MRLFLLLFAAASLTACSGSDVGFTSEGEELASTVFDDEDEARDASPSGEVCLISGELKTEIICVPDNRGKNGKCTDREVVTDTRIWEIAFLRGDVDYNGTVGDRDDAQLATKKLYTKQFDNQPCPAAADITEFAGVEGRGDYDPDGFFTSNDINLWRDVKRGANLTQELAEEDLLICASQCQIPNHMDPDYKKN
jgi:hypothetical protein